MDSKKKNQIFTYGFLILWMGTAGHALYLNYQEGQHTAYWSSQPEIRSDKINRSPSALLDFDPDSLEVYRDFFEFENFQKYLTYELTLNIFTEGEQSLSEQAFKEAINETIMQKKGSNNEKGLESHDKGLLALIEGNLFSNLISSFKTKLEKRSVKNGKFQINFNFTPRTNPEFGYDEELSSNQLIDWSSRGSLLEQIYQPQKSFEERIIQSAVPASSDVYQYKGGQISLWFDLENSGNGFIRVRRYFRASELANSNVNISDDSFRVNLVHFKSLKKENRVGIRENFVTVDLYKTFSLEGERSKIDRVELHFGKVLPEQFHQKDLSRGLASYTDKVIETSELNIHGVLNFHDKEHMFISKIEKLVFDFKEGEFSSKSKLNTVFKGGELQGNHIGVAQHKVFNKLVNDYGIQLIESFKLGEIHAKFGGKKKK